MHLTPDLVPGGKPIGACRLCGARQLAPLHSFGKQPVAGYLESDVDRAIAAPKLELALVMCEGCGLVQQASNEAQQLLVDKVYARYQPTYGMSSGVSAYLQGWIDQAIAMSGAAPGDSVVEIGANDGSLLALLEQRGFVATGFEPSPNLAEIAARRGLGIVQELFGEESARRFRAKHGPVKLVVTRHTLEHALDPRDFMRGMSTLLAPGGSAVIEVPDLRLQLASNQFQSMTFQHTAFFSIRSMSQGLMRAGLVPESVRHVDMDGGSMVLHARLLDGGTPGASIAESIALERQIGLDEARAMKEYFAGVAAFCERARNMLRTLRSEGNGAIGYGAGSKGQALVNMIGLDREELPFVIDDTPGNAGQYIPGTSIQVLGSDDPRAQGARVILITAPTHAKEIIRKERLRRGIDVRFLLTSPDLHFAPG